MTTVELRTSIMEELSPCKVECLYLPKNEVSKHLLTRNTTNDASIR